MMPAPARKRWVALLVAVAASAPGVALTLHSLGVVPFAYETISLSGFQAMQGAAYAAALPADAFFLTEEPDQVVFENGHPLPLPYMPGWGVVANEGGGRYLVEGSALYFSTTDNSDPRSNGRTYTIR